MSLRIGIVGAGANTRSRHIPGFQQIDGVEVTAVCNRTRASGQKAADEFGIARVFDDWRELVAADEVDADGLADTLEKDIDHVKVLKIKERRLRKDLKKIQERRRKIRSRILRKI